MAAAWDRMRLPGVMAGLVLRLLVAAAWPSMRTCMRTWRRFMTASAPVSARETCSGSKQEWRQPLR